MLQTNRLRLGTAWFAQPDGLFPGLENQFGVNHLASRPVCLESGAVVQALRASTHSSE